MPARSVLISERLFRDATGRILAVRVEFNSTGLTLVVGDNVQVALTSVDGVLVAHEVELALLAEGVDEALAAAAAALAAAVAAQATADEALAAGGAGGRTFAFFMS